MSKSFRVPQRPKLYQPKVEKEKSFKIRGTFAKKKIKHKKAYYDDESDTP